MPFDRRARVGVFEPPVFVFDSRSGCVVENEVGQVFADVGEEKREVGDTWRLDLQDAFGQLRTTDTTIRDSLRLT